jgi:hypothetical protein
MEVIEFKNSQKANEDVIQELEELLLLAKEGQIRGFVLFGAGSEGDILHVTMGEIYAPIVAWAYRAWELDQFL